MAFLNKLNPGFKQFLWKTILFAGLFIIFSGIIGTQLFQYGLLEKWKIEIYGRIGYILLFSIAGFILLYRERLLKLESFRHRTKDYLVLITSFIFLGIFYLFEKSAGNFEINFTNIILAHLLLIVTMIFLVFGCYGWSFISNFIRQFKKELLYFLGFGIITASLMQTVWSLWPYFSLIVTKAVYFLLTQVSDNVKLIPPRTLFINNFGAQIAEACSGVYSIFLFTALYLFIVFLDWKKLNKKKVIILFVPAIAGAFLINILRVFLLMVVGAFISRELAMSLYHSYSGMIFFLIYFALFWLIFYKWMKKTEFRREDDKKQVYFVKKKIGQVMADSLYRNSIYLMLNMLIMSVFGFIFWIIVTKLYSVNEVGLATGLISVMGLITGLAGLGLGTGLIRYLPTAENKNKKINTAFTLVIISTIIFTSIFLIFSKFIAPKLMFVHDNIILAFIFIIFMIISSFNSILESIFTAYRNTKFIVLKSTIFSVLKIIMPFFLVFLGAYGIFSSWMIALFIGLVVNLFVLIIKFNYRPRFAVYDSILKKIGGYSFGNYVAGFIGSLPTLILPLLILSKLGADQSAYYYMAMMIAGLLFTIPNSTANSLFAEGSYDEKTLSRQIKKAVKIIVCLLIPAIIITIFLGQYVLLAFGKAYSTEGFKFLQIMAVSGIFIGINSVFGSLLKVKKRIKAILMISVISALLILGGSWILIGRGLGLLGIGYAYLIGQAVMTGVYGIVFKIKK